MLFSVLLLSFIPGEFCLEFIILYDTFEVLDPSLKISCQGDSTWGDVYPYSEGNFKPYWKTKDCRTLILPEGKTLQTTAGSYFRLPTFFIYICNGLDRMCSLLEAGSKGIKGSIYFNFEEPLGFVTKCDSLIAIDLTSVKVSYYNFPIFVSYYSKACGFDARGISFRKNLPENSLGSEITPGEPGGLKSIVISNSQVEPTNGDRYIFRVSILGLSDPWFMVFMCAKEEARKECFSDMTVMREKVGFDVLSLPIAKNSVTGDIYLQISVYTQEHDGLTATWLHDRFFTYRLIKKAEKEFERTVLTYYEGRDVVAYLHVLHCPSDYTDCDKDGTRDVVVTIFGISSKNQAEGLLVQGVKPAVNFDCVVTSHTCRATVTAFLHKSTMFNYTPEEGCLEMLPPRTSSHVFECGGIFIQIKESD